MTTKEKIILWLSLSIILMITVPFIVIGVLFILSHYQMKGKLPGRKQV